MDFGPYFPTYYKSFKKTIINDYAPLFIFALIKQFSWNFSSSDQVFGLVILTIIKQFSGGFCNNSFEQRLTPDTETTIAVAERQWQCGALLVMML